MIDNGDAYIIMLKIMHMVPTMVERFSWEWARVNVHEVSVAMKINSIVIHSKILSLFL